jgi:hypothetical protein
MSGKFVFSGINKITGNASEMIAYIKEFASQMMVE